MVKLFEKERMPKHVTSADLPEDLARFAEAQIAAGNFATVEEVLWAGKDALETIQRRQVQTTNRLRVAIVDGDASPDFEGNPFTSVRAELGLPQR